MHFPKKSFWRAWHRSRVSDLWQVRHGSKITMFGRLTCIKIKLNQTWCSQNHTLNIHWTLKTCQDWPLLRKPDSICLLSPNVPNFKLEEVSKSNFVPKYKSSFWINLLENKKTASMIAQSLGLIPDRRVTECLHLLYLSWLSANDLCFENEIK